MTRADLPIVMRRVRDDETTASYNGDPFARLGIQLWGHRVGESGNGVCGIGSRVDDQSPGV